MAKITIEELSESLKEYLNGLGLTEAQVQELIDKFEDEKIGDISQLSTENKTNIVTAINELFQSANNGKELIASAIGEPLDASDTFSAMSNDINGLLATFKTNMMNNGVTVEGTDKFKALIDKIATMSGGLNIISATELPATGNDNQICVVMDNPVDNFTLAYTGSSIADSSSVVLHYHNDDPNYTTKSGNHTLQYNIASTLYNSKYYSSYYWRDSFGEWTKLTDNSLYVALNDVTPAPGYTFRLNGGLTLQGGYSNYYVTTTSSKIDFSLYSRIEIDANTTGSSMSAYVGLSSTAQSATRTSDFINNFCSQYYLMSTSSNRQTFTFDISSWTDKGYLLMYLAAGNSSVLIHNIRLVY